MAFHCGAPTRDGSPCQRHVRDLATRCPQHRNLGGTALHPPRHAMRTIELSDPVLTSATTAWTQRDRVTTMAEGASADAPTGTQLTEDDGERATPPEPVAARSHLDRERSRRVHGEVGGEGGAEAGGEAVEVPRAQSEAEREPDTTRPSALLSYLDRERAERERRAQAEHEAEPERTHEPEPGPEHDAARPSALLSYLDRERARRLQEKRERSTADSDVSPEPEPAAAEPISALSYLADQRAARDQQLESEPETAPYPPQRTEPEPRPVEQRPQLRKERALDPDWIGGRPLFRDEAATRPMPKIEFEPSEGRAPRRPPRVPPMRSVVLNPASEAPQSAVTPNGFAAESDPPTLIDRMPPIAHDDLVVPDFLRPDFGAPAAAPEPDATRPPLPQRVPRPWPIPKKPKADPDPPTLIDPHPPIAAAAPPAVTNAPHAATTAPGRSAAPTASAPTASARPTPTASVPTTPGRPTSVTGTPTAPVRPAPAATAPASRPTAAKPAAKPAATTTPAAPPATTTAPPSSDDIAVPDFLVPGFAQPAQKPPLRTVLSTVLGPDLWQRCYVEWSPAHCTALARIARTVDGLAPSASAAMRSTAGAGMRWLGVAREREQLADEVAAAISHPVGATTSNQARTVRLYGAAICMALNVPLRRCACHRDLERDVSGELIRLGLEELAGEVT